jgi:hypothetical protein
VTMRKPYKHKFRVRLFRMGNFVRWENFRPPVTVSIRLNRSRDAALQRILRDTPAPEGWRWVLANDN